MDKLQKISIFLYCLIIVITIIITRFTNSSLTETQLFLKFWWLYIPLGILAMPLGFWINKSDKDEDDSKC